MTVAEKYFTLPDLLSAFTWLVILSLIVFYQSSKIKFKREKNIFILNFYFKILFAFIFTTSYLFIYGGGDTSAYWDGAECIQNLLWEDPAKGIQHLFTTPSLANYNSFFSASTGYPPVWIYSEAESYFVSKVTAIVGLFTLKSYLATTFIFAYLFALSNWKLYEVAKKTKLFKPKMLPLALLFIPSVSFWCAGVSKDTIILISIFYIFYLLYYIIIGAHYRKLKLWLLLFFFVVIIYSTRNFILVVILIPLMFAGMVHLFKKFKFSPILRIPLNFLFVFLVIGAITGFLSSEKGIELIATNGFLQEALVVQYDFKNNQFYGKNQYDIGAIDQSPLGIISKIPISVFSGIFQPFPWNAGSSALILNGIESTLLIFLLLKITISGQAIRWLNQIRKNEVLVFCGVFIIIIAFMAGFTSMLYGVLVRIRAPLLPFAFLLLSLVIPSKKTLNHHEKPN